ncbi:MAG: hypothetical protein K0S25_2120, partial [Bacillus sp. (in: firmicutes)]|nr:hypothetical protein [Bacillus sp. (in: firmicutes)]
MRKWILSGIGILLLIIALFSIVYIRALNPVKLAEEKAIAAANKKVKLVEIQDVQIYNGNETYYVLKGINQQKQKVIVWVSAKNGDVTV